MSCSPINESRQTEEKPSGVAPGRIGEVAPLERLGYLIGATYLLAILPAVWGKALSTDWGIGLDLNITIIFWGLFIASFSRRFQDWYRGSRIWVCLPLSLSIAGILCGLFGLWFGVVDNSVDMKNPSMIIVKTVLVGWIVFKLIPRTGELTGREWRQVGLRFWAPSGLTLSGILTLNCVLPGWKSCIGLEPLLLVCLSHSLLLWDWRDRLSCPRIAMAGCVGLAFFLVCPPLPDFEYSNDMERLFSWITNIPVLVETIGSPETIQGLLPSTSLIDFSKLMNGANGNNSLSSLINLNHSLLLSGMAVSRIYPLLLLLFITVGIRSKLWRRVILAPVLVVCFLSMTAQSAFHPPWMNSSVSPTMYSNGLNVNAPPIFHPARFVIAFMVVLMAGFVVWPSRDDLSGFRPLPLGFRRWLFYLAGFVLGGWGMGIGFAFVLGLTNAKTSKYHSPRINSDTQEVLRRLARPRELQSTTNTPTLYNDPPERHPNRQEFTTDSLAISNEYNRPKRFDPNWGLRQIYGEENSRPKVAMVMEEMNNRREWVEAVRRLSNSISLDKIEPAPDVVHSIDLYTWSMNGYLLSWAGLYSAEGGRFDSALEWTSSTLVLSRILDRISQGSYNDDNKNARKLDIAQSTLSLLLEQARETTSTLERFRRIEMIRGAAGLTFSWFAFRDTPLTSIRPEEIISLSWPIRCMFRENYISPFLYEFRPVQLVVELKLHWIYAQSRILLFRHQTGFWPQDWRQVCAVSGKDPVDGVIPNLVAPFDRYLVLTPLPDDGLSLTWRLPRNHPCSPNIYPFLKPSGQLQVQLHYDPEKKEKGP